MSGSLKDELAALLRKRIIDELTQLLFDETNDNDIFDILQPIIPAIVDLGISEGYEYVRLTLQNLASDNPYPGFKTLIDLASPEDRILLMEGTRQTAAAEVLRRIKQKEQQWTFLNTVLKVGIGVLSVLLV